MITQVDPRPWICKFIEVSSGIAVVTAPDRLVHKALQTFENAESGAMVVRSVTFLHEDSPLSHIADTLGQPRLTDAPNPQSAFLKENFDGSVLTESKAKLFVFKNASAAKKLDVFVWTVEPEDGDALTAVMLQSVDM